MRRIHQEESADVLSLTMQSLDGQPLPTALPGQYVVLRLPRTQGRTPLSQRLRPSGPASTERYRISVKIEPNRAAGSYLREHARVGDALDVSSPRGSFIPQAGERPVVLLSAGIGATPVLAMLHALAAVRSTRQVLWLYAARDRQHHPFVAEVRRPRSRSSTAAGMFAYSRPGSRDKLGEDFDATGHLSRSVFDAGRLPRERTSISAGPNDSMEDMQRRRSLGRSLAADLRRNLQRQRVDDTRVVGTATRSPHVPKDDANSGPPGSFARSGIATAHWKASAYQSILELAEACDVPVRWSCRTGVCHNCESGLVSGAVAYEPQPLEKPADANLLICCSQPIRDVVIDL